MSQEWKLVPVEPTQPMLDGMTTERKKGNGVLQMWFEALAAAPVPPAGGEPGAVEGLRQLVIGTYPDPDVEGAHDDYLDDHQSQALWLLRNAGRIEIHVTRLQAESSGWKAMAQVAMDGKDQLRHERDDLKAEVGFLMKRATELKAERDALAQRLTVADQQVDELESESFEGLYNAVVDERDSALALLQRVIESGCVSYEGREMLSQLEADICAAIAHQSAPAAKGGE